MAARSLDIRKGLVCDAHISETRKVKKGGVEEWDTWQCLTTDISGGYMVRV